MIYAYLKFVVGIAIRIFYRVEIKGLEKIPHDKPVILSCNHVNAFMDALILYVSVKPKIYSLVRSDVFKGGIVKWFFAKVGMVPIYRMQEGMENLQKNQETFKTTATLLKKNKIIIIFSEGNCVQERRLRRLRKGMARIVFGSEEQANFNLDIQVVPVGINYSKPWKFGSRLFVNIGEAVVVKPFIDEYKADKARTINKFTKSVEDQMAGLMEIIKDPADDTFIEQAEILEGIHDDKNESLQQKHLRSKDLINALEKFKAEAPEMFTELKARTARYFSELKENGLRDWLLRPETITGMNAKSVMLDFLYFFFGFPLFLFGWIINIIPFTIPKKIADKIVKHIEFHASINLGAATFIFQIWYLILGILAFVFLPEWWMAVIFILLMAVSGFFMVAYKKRMKRSKGKGRLLNLMMKDRGLVERLVKERIATAEALRRLG